MPIHKLISLFDRSARKDNLPRRITTSSVNSYEGRKFLDERDIVSIGGQPITLRATRKGGFYTISVTYKAGRFDPKPFSPTLYRAEKKTLKLYENVSPTDMLIMLAKFETEGRGHKLRPDDVGVDLGKVPRRYDGVVHIATLLKDPKIMARIRPHLYTASRLKRIRMRKTGSHLKLAA